MNLFWSTPSTTAIPKHPSPYPAKADIYQSPLRHKGKSINLSKTAFQLGKFIGESRRLRYIRFNCEFGTVGFYVEQLRANCGISLLSSPTWHVAYDKEKEFGSHKKKLEDKFQEFLMLHADRNKLLVSDRVGGSLWYNFCSRHGWREGAPTFNGNSDNDVVTFETDREQLIGRDLYITYSDER